MKPQALVFNNYKTVTKTYSPLQSNKHLKNTINENNLKFVKSLLLNICSL